jgi:hypothetical protein
LQARINLPPSNAELAELLSREANEASYVLQRAYRRAARSAFLWEAEARDLVAAKRPLTELAHIGPFLQKQIRQWIRRRQHPPRPPPCEKNFSPRRKSPSLAKAASWRSRLRGDLQMTPLERWLGDIHDGGGGQRAVTNILPLPIIPKACPLRMELKSKAEETIS